jgi:hypothetical protein
MGRAVAAVLVAVCLSNCASMTTFNPQSGMSFKDWERSAALSFRGRPELVGLKGTTSVYYLPTSNEHNTFYWFENGYLSQVTQGQLPQIRYQIETLNR